MDFLVVQGLSVTIQRLVGDIVGIQGNFIIGFLILLDFEVNGEDQIELVTPHGQV